MKQILFIILIFLSLNANAQFGVGGTSASNLSTNYKLDSIRQELIKIKTQDSIEYAKCDTFHLDTLDVRIINDSIWVKNDSLLTYILNDSINVYLVNDTLDVRARITNDSLKIYGNVNIANDSLLVHLINHDSSDYWLQAMYIQDSIEYSKCDTFHLDTLDVNIINDSLKVYGNVNVTNDSINVHILNNGVAIPYDFAQIWLADGSNPFVSGGGEYHSVTVTITGSKCSLEVDGVAVTVYAGYTATWTATNLISSKIVVDCTAGGGEAIVHTIK